MRYNRFMLSFVFFIFFAGYAIAAEIKTVTEDVVYYHNGQDVKEYLARPDDNQKHKGIILIHEWWGLNDNIRENAKKFIIIQGLFYKSMGCGI